MTERLLLRVQGRVDARMAGRMAVLRGGDLNEPAAPRQRWSVPQHNTQQVGAQAARPTPGVHSPSTALRRSRIARAARACSVRFGPPAAHRDERAGLRGRPLIAAPCINGSWEGHQPHASTTKSTLHGIRLGRYKRAYHDP